MNRKKILDNYKKEIKKYQKYSRAYYDKNNSLISDSDFDEIKKKIIQLEKAHKFLKDPNSPTNSIGYKPSKNFEKVSHRVPMLSLANAFNEEDLDNFEKKILNYLNKKK